ncbi:unnamed protein product [Rangifer tarandus platyrhynchus]|uniref:Collagen alpha-1(I) chain-like n=1 Tax=Rangifer tarandus platyrhynchus TaxID=3082113 RepID=A0ABN8YM78_RANTA|nr:unnamed protein product [Rangifer tarandus platyrhynchus]
MSRRRRPTPSSGARPSGRPDSGALPAPRAPARAAPARRCRAPPPPPPPPPPGLHRLLRPSGCRTLPDRAPNQAAQSPSLLFGPPCPTKRRPDWRDARRAPVQSQGPPGSEAPSQPHAEAPAGLGRAGPAARARGRAGAEGRCRPSGSAGPALCSFRRKPGASQEGGGSGARGRRASRARFPEPRAGRRAGRGGGNRPEGGTARSRRLAGTAASVFPGRRGGAGPKAKFEPVQNSGVVTVSTAALFFTARAAEAPGRRAGGAGREGPQRPVCGPDALYGPSSSRASLGRGAASLPRCGRAGAPSPEPSGAPCPLLLSAAAPRPLGPTRVPRPAGLWLVDPAVPIALETLGKREVTIISNSSFRAPCSDPFQCL